jgi:fermentation-respiration switch protein FrsA (DUF1100 family)
MFRVVRIPLVAYLLIVVLAMVFEDQLIFVPSKFPLGDWHPQGLGQEDAWFQAADGTKLHGWYVPHPKPRAFVLFCHGNGGNITDRAFILRSLRDVVGAAVFIFDYRGYGRSEGKPNEEGILADARAARRWLAARAKIPEKQIVVMGESLGGAVAVELAAAGGARAMILESTFSSLPDVAAYHYPWLPVGWFLRTKLNSAQRIKAYHGPLLQTHGDNDHIVPERFGRRLFEAANEPKQFITIRGGDHNDARDRAYYEKLRDFVAGLPVSDKETTGQTK